MDLMYILFNTLCGAANSPNELILFRFLAGIRGAGPFAVISSTACSESKCLGPIPHIDRKRNDGYLDLSSLV
ncbi:uncharacterized protein BDV17DRAFT_248512 [Aspergillus undulatus]|uniref:uncharacterized protein n=1 Tax=Aspergillus undulatus TaxID=1810928 RepID=UPI003CCD074C